MCVCVFRDRGVNVHAEIGLCVLGVRVSVWMESHGCDSRGRVGGVCVEAEMGVCVCVWRDCSEHVGVCGHSGVWVQVETGVYV